MKLPTMLLLDVKNEYEYYCLLRFMCYTKIIYFSRAKRKSQRKISRECIYIYIYAHYKWKGKFETVSFENTKKKKIIIIKFIASLVLL